MTQFEELGMKQNVDAGMEAQGATDQTSGVAVLDRMFAIFNAFGPSDDSLTLAELSRRTDLYKSTILRLLAALEHGKFIRKLRDGQYAIGPAPLRLAALYQRSFAAGPIIEPLLQSLSHNIGETASFYVRQNDKRLVLYRVEPSRSVRVSIRVGEAFPIAKGASGKVLLAFTERQDSQWSAVRECLWAVSYGERDPETVSVSAPVFGVTGELAGALTMSGPNGRFDDPVVLRDALRTLLASARQATAGLGGQASQFDSTLSVVNADDFVLPRP